MTIAIASSNPVKVEALAEIITDYPHLKGANIAMRETQRVG